MSGIVFQQLKLTIRKEANGQGQGFVAPPEI
jgi:hypothetical protein